MLGLTTRRCQRSYILKGVSHHRCDSETKLRAETSGHYSCIKKILNLRCWKRASHTEILRRVDFTFTQNLLVRRQLRWLSHVMRMPSNTLPRRTTNGDLTDGKQYSGAQKKRYKDRIKMSLANAWMRGKQLATKGTIPSNCKCIEEADAAAPADIELLHSQPTNLPVLHLRLCVCTRAQKLYTSAQKPHSRRLNCAQQRHRRTNCTINQPLFFK